MVDSIVSIILLGRVFLRRCVGLVVSPYQTCRQIAAAGQMREGIYIAFLLVVYFSLAVIVKNDLFRPFLLTRQFLSLAIVIVVSAYGMARLTYTLGKLLGGIGTFYSYVLLWFYSLIPTVGWFLFTSILYIVLPPPRTVRLEGIIASIVFLGISIGFLCWKGILLFLSLRFGLKLTAVKIGIVWILAAPVVILYSIAMYKLNIFVVPFL